MEYGLFFKVDVVRDELMENNLAKQKKIREMPGTAKIRANTPLIQRLSDPAGSGNSNPGK